MSNPLLLDIVTFLTNEGVVVGDGIDAFRDFTPEAPDALVALHEYKGDAVVFYEPSVNRSVQIIVRDCDADAARQRCLAICKLLTKDNLIVNFTPDRWGQVHIRQTPFSIGQDENNRTSYCFNVGITTNIE